MAQYLKPLPTITPLNQPYWDALKRHELRMQQCQQCAKVWYPPSPLCPRCWSRKFDWTPLSGHGRVSSWVVFHQSYFKGFEGEIPYNVAEVELAEGPRLMTNLVAVANGDIRAGMPVEIVYDDVTEELTLARFRPAKA
ncbi:MAG TPA: Zn-ribbon domain-containing OB-fold protein [Candidatus Binataceae bacterium]|nr:Zn-ribbon domain-containing OB-fold protein [Candidatus Binataceae bacterium]